MNKIDLIGLPIFKSQIIISYLKYEFYAKTKDCTLLMLLINYAHMTILKLISGSKLH